MNNISMRIISKGAKEALETTNELIAALQKANRLISELNGQVVDVTISFSDEQEDERSSCETEPVK